MPGGWARGVASVNGLRPCGERRCEIPRRFGGDDLEVEAAAAAEAEAEAVVSDGGDQVGPAITPPPPPLTWVGIARGDCVDITP